jgi:hypothetical protein
LLQAPAWPVLVWNLVRWRADHLPGLGRTNLRLGETTVLRVRPGTEAVTVVAPDGSRRDVPAHGRQVVLRGDDLGVYEVETPGGKHSFAVNALNPRTSDLSGHGSGRWGTWQEEETPQTESRDWAWLLLLVAGGVLLTHQLLIALAGRGASA